MDNLKFLKDAAHWEHIHVSVSSWIVFLFVWFFACRVAKENLPQSQRLIAILFVLIPRRQTPLAAGAAGVVLGSLWVAGDGDRNTTSYLQSPTSSSREDEHARKKIQKPKRQMYIHIGVDIHMKFLLTSQVKRDWFCLFFKAKFHAKFNCTAIGAKIKRELTCGLLFLQSLRTAACSAFYS